MNRGERMKAENTGQTPPLAEVSSSEIVSWRKMDENQWYHIDGQSFVVREDDGKWYAWLDDGSNRRRGPYETLEQAIKRAS